MSVPESSPRRVPPTLFVKAPVQEAAAVTDKGRSIALFRYETVVISPEGQPVAITTEEAQKDFLRSTELQFCETTGQDLRGVVRLAEPLPACNCHGWIFAGGQFGIHDADVPAILADNGYVAVENAELNDLAVFSSGPEISHSAMVRSVSGGHVVVESKWGPFGVFQHAVGAHPFPGTCCFYRSLRRSHALAIKARTAE